MSDGVVRGADAVAMKSRAQELFEKMRGSYANATTCAEQKGSSSPPSFAVSFPDSSRSELEAEGPRGTGKPN